MKLARGNFKANRRRYFFTKCVSSVVEFLAIGGWRHYQTNCQRDTKPLVICESLEAKGLFWKSISLYLWHLLLATISCVSLFCGQTGFYSGKNLYSIIYLSSILNPYTQQQSLLSALMLCGWGTGECTQVVTPHYIMENIQAIAIVQMPNFSKQAELGKKWFSGSKQLSHSFKLNFQSI